MEADESEEHFLIEKIKQNNKEIVYHRFASLALFKEATDSELGTGSGAAAKNGCIFFISTVQASTSWMPYVVTRTLAGFSYQLTVFRCITN